MDVTQRSKFKKNKANEKKHVTSSNKKATTSVFATFFSFLIIFIMPTFVLLLNDFVYNHNLNHVSLIKELEPSNITTYIMKIWSVDLSKLKFAFYTTGIFVAFQIVIMKILPGKLVYGPLTSKGNQPVYKDNGFKCYIVTMIAFGIFAYLLEEYTDYTVGIIYDELHSFLYCFNLIGFLFCLILYIKGLLSPSSTDSGTTGNFIFDYYWGTELYPRLFGVDVKVFTNCRFGMTIWPIFLLCFMRESLTMGLDYGIMVNVFLQMIYITKFFWWEYGYYNTLDIILDRAGFYICWGCLVFVPGFYTFSTYTMVRNITGDSRFYTIALGMGIVSLTLNYWADYQKQVFRAKNGKVKIWNKPAKYIEATYTDSKKKIRKSLLLTSGFWGLARHFNYLAELVLAFSWCSSAGFSYIWPFSYFIFLVILLVHRDRRDNDKCSEKYGHFFEEYKQKVPYKIIPYIY